MYADLHLHTRYSDGTNCPVEILDMAQNAGIKVISITDHDLYEGSQEAFEYINDYPIRLIKGIELTSLHKRCSAHVLGYYVDYDSTALNDYLKASTARMTESARVNFENAKKEGVIDFSWERVLELNPERSFVGGVHAIAAMRHDGYFPKMSFHEFFGKYFSSYSKDFIMTKMYSPFEAIDVIKAAGGIPVLAHPTLIGDDAAVMDMIDHGAMGIEVYHPTNSEEDSARYLSIAIERGLYVTGGTDWHGKNSAQIITHFGMRGLPDENYDILKV